MDNGKTKILFILTKSGIGGAQKYVADLTENLDKKKIETKIFYGGKDASGITTAALERSSSNKIRWLSNRTRPWFLFFNDWMAIFEIAGILKNEMPDVIHLNSSKAGFIGAISAAIANLGSPKKIKVVFTAHGWVFNPTNELNFLVRYFYIFLHWFAAKFQDKIICVSEYDRNLALKYKICPQNKLAGIHNGVDPNMKFIGKKEARRDLILKIKKTFDVNQNDGISKNNTWPWIGSIGRLVKEKNYETFLGAAGSIPNAYFFIIGEGSEYENLKLKIKNLKLTDRFFMIPPSENGDRTNGSDAQYLKAFDIFVMSSIKEGLPYILLEAMTAELPTVVTETGGVPEMIQNHENGLMVAQKNPEALAHAISGLIANPNIARDLAKKAKEVAANKFGLSKMVKETEEVYQQVLK
ncbi:MAG: glycosyltransferase [Patescibacteria group bacterium]|nr:glycosyltransferase [Patescibacteria group bacterium]